MMGSSWSSSNFSSDGYLSPKTAKPDISASARVNFVAPVRWSGIFENTLRMMPSKDGAEQFVGAL